MNKVCPFCDEPVSYWPNCSPSTNSDYYNVGWVIRKGKKTKDLFHLSCYRKACGKDDKHTERNP